jgi:hypothetical protein
MVIRFAMHGQRQDSSALGFLPLVTLERYADRDWIQSCRINNELVSYIVYGLHRDGMKIYQIWTVKDARRMAAAAAVIAAAEAAAVAAGIKKSSAWVAEDLEAVSFWKALGYLLCGIRTGGNARRRIHYRFERDITESKRAPASTLVLA